MPVHIERMDNEVTVVDGELPLTDRQVEKLVNIVLSRLEGKQREAQKRQEATKLRRGSAPPVRFGE